jgi:hypothetical protein
MKKILLLAIVFFLLLRCSNSLKAQEYIPIPLDSTMWKIHYWVSHPGPNNDCECYGYTYTLGDTIINSKNYTIVDKLFNPSCLPCIGRAYNPIKKAAIRQDSIERKVYIIRLPVSLNERILYDDRLSCGYLLINS